MPSWPLALLAGLLPLMATLLSWAWPRPGFGIRLHGPGG